MGKVAGVRLDSNCPRWIMIRWASQFDYTTVTTVVNLGQLSHRWCSLSDAFELAFVAETIDFSGGDFFANLSLIQFLR